MIHLRVLGSPDLRRADGQEIRYVLVQPKRVALLAYLTVAAPRGFHRRDSLVARFWPELDAERARAALRNAIYQLRQALGPDSLETRGAEEVRLAEAACWCDALEFQEALAGGRLDEAVALYRGDLLSGLHVEGAPDVGHWLDRERERLREAAVRAGWALAERELAAGENAAAVERARWAADLEPGSEAGLRRLMAVLDRVGDGPGALRAYDHFAAWLAADLGASPSAETRRLAEDLRRRAATPSIRSAAPLREEAAGAEAPASAPAPPAAPRVPERRWTPPRRRAVWTVGALAAVAVLFMAALRVHAPGGVRPAPTEVHPSTRSAAASALFREGLRAHYAGDGQAAERLYHAALREDTTFALAALYAASVSGADYPNQLALLDRAVRLADRWSPDRERLLVRATWAVNMDDPAALRAAETLAARHPEEPDGQLLLGRTLIQRGLFAAGAERLRRVIAMDTAGLRTPGARCRACEALPALVSAYHHLDALGDAERLIEEWRRLQPHSANPLYSLADTRDTQGRSGEALAALREAAALENPPAWAEVRPAESYLRAGDYAAADALLRTLIREGSPEHRKLALWFLVISLRHQGRFGEALAAAERYHGEFRYELPRATVLWDMGRLREAAAAFQRISRYRTPNEASGASARWRAWSLTHYAGVVAELGDTATLRSLADTIQAVGARSAYGRDHRLHHHVRGLLWSARGRHDSAVAAFRRAQFSPTYGYNRVNLELARALVRAGRPGEAVPVLRSALRTGVSSTGMYTTAPALHRMLGNAWLAAGRPDSAATHFRRTLGARRNADPQFATEVAYLRSQLARLEAIAPQTATNLPTANR